jgi:hypothetical protein
LWNFNKKSILENKFSTFFLIKNKKKALYVRITKDKRPK